MSDDDWFERVLNEDDAAGEDGTPEGSPDGDDADADAGAEPGTDDADTTASDGESDEVDDGATADADPFAGLDAGADGQDPEQDPGVDDGEMGADGADAAGATDPTDGADAMEDPFGGDFASAFENAPSPPGDGNGDGLGDADTGGPGGFGDADTGAPGGFDGDEGEIDSNLDRIDIGIEGLDEMILGGVPRRSLMTAIGSAGTGKTTFALQFLYRALEQDRRGVYITLEESRSRILDTADEKGWEFSRHVEEGRLAVVDLDPVEMTNSLSSMRNDLPRLVDEFGASRLVLDSVSLLEMMYDHPATRRSEVFNFTRSLKKAGVTTMFTSEAADDNAYASRHGLVEYLADAVFVLQYVRPSDFRETRLAIEIQKIRDANHSRETKPYEITNDGISVYRQANIF